MKINYDTAMKDLLSKYKKQHQLLHQAQQLGTKDKVDQIKKEIQHIEELMEVYNHSRQYTESGVPAPHVLREAELFRDINRKMDDYYDYTPSSPNGPEEWDFGSSDFGLWVEELVQDYNDSRAEEHENNGDDSSPLSFNFRNEEE